MALSAAFIMTLLAMTVLLGVQLVLMIKYGNDPWEPGQYRKVAWIWIVMGACYALSAAVGSYLGGNLMRWWVIFILLGIGFLAWHNFRKADKLTEPR